MQTGLKISFTQKVRLQLHGLKSQVKVNQPSDWFLPRQGLVTLRRGRTKDPRTITVRLQDSIWARPNERVSATNKVLLDS
jgi:hypothetical protein